MDGHRSEYPDYLSQSSSPVVPNSFAPSLPSYAGGFGRSPQVPAYGARSSARPSLAGLDLNCSHDGFPFVNSYQELLQGDGVPAGAGLPSLGIGSRSVGGAFVPPRPTGGASGSGKRPAARSAGRRTKSGSGKARVALSASRMPPPGMRGSMASGSSYGPSDAVEEEEEGDNVFPDEVSYLQYNLICFDLPTVIY